MVPAYAVRLAIKQKIAAKVLMSAPFPVK